MLERDLLGRIAVIGQGAGEHLIEHDAERIEVAAGVRLEPLGLLGGDIVHGADGRIGPAAAVFVLEGGDAEVCHLGDAVAVDHDVLGLDIAVDDAVLVRVLEGLRDLGGEKQRLRRGEPALAVDILLERDALDELHDDILHRERMAHIVHRDDVRVAEHGDGLRLGLELRLELGIGENLLAQHLDGDIAVETVIERFIDNGHAAGADDLEKLVAVIQQLADIFVLRLVHKIPPLWGQKIAIAADTLSRAPLSSARFTSAWQAFFALRAAPESESSSSSERVLLRPSPDAHRVEAPRGYGVEMFAD